MCGDQLHDWQNELEIGTLYPLIWSPLYRQIDQLNHKTQIQCILGKHGQQPINDGWTQFIFIIIYDLKSE